MDRKPKERGREKFYFNWGRACEKVVREVQENPPRLICWLKGGINSARADKIRREIEGRESLTPGEVAKNDIIERG